MKVQTRPVYRWATKPIIDRKGWYLDAPPSFMDENLVKAPVAKIAAAKSDKTAVSLR